MRFKSKALLFLFLVITLSVSFAGHNTAFALVAQTTGKTLLDALPQISDMPDGYHFDKREGEGFHDYSAQSSNSYSFITGKRTYSWTNKNGMSFTEYDFIRVASYGNYREGINDSYAEWSPEKFRALRLTWGEKGHSIKPYEGLPGGVIEEHTEVDSYGSVNIFTRIYFWKSRECNGDIYIQYRVSNSYRNTRPSFEERVAAAKAFCRPQIERLAKLIYSRLPEGTGSSKEDVFSTPSGSEGSQQEPLSAEATLLAVAGGSMVMALGAFFQLLGMGGLQNITDVRGLIESLLSSSSTDADLAEAESALRDMQTAKEAQVVPKEPETAAVVQPVIPDPIPPGFEYQGKVWYQPPWDTGGPYWMSKSDYNAMRSMMRQGMVWSDRWGWVDPAEGKAMESQRAAAWDEYKSNTDQDIKALTDKIDESQKKLADIRENLDELDKIEKMRERLAELERQRVLDNSFATQLSETWENYEKGVNRDLDALPGDLGRLALSAAREIRDTTGQLITAAGDTAEDIYREVTDVDNYKAVGQAAVDTAKQLILHPVDASVQVGDTVKAAGRGALKAAGAVGNVAVAIASNPIGFAEAVIGIDNWKKVVDPNVSVGERVVRALYGAVDASLNFASGGTKVAVEGMEAGIDGVKLIKGAEAGADAAKAAKGAEAVTDAAKAAHGAETASDAAKITAKLDDPARVKAWEAGRMAGQQKADKLADALKSGDAGDIKKALVECQKDKHAIQSLNKGDDSIKLAYNQKMKELITDDVDQVMKEKIAQRYGVDPKDVEIVKPTNPTAKPKVGSDLDFTVKVKAKPGEIVADPNNPGKFIKVEPGDVLTKDVPVKDAQQIYNRELYSKVTGEPIPTDPEKFKAFQAEADNLAHDMDHVAGHRVGTESYGASQKDLDVILQKSGGQFTDPEQAGKLASFKSNHLYQQAENIAKVNPGKAEALISDGMRQTTKQYSNLIETRVSALQSKGIDVAVDPRLTKAVDILKQVENTGMAPAKAEALLKAQLNMSKDDVANMLGTQLAKLHMVKA
ncbi:MAG: hypothetical protein CVU62_00450 [Deltaproteobacteria bacterium HGW-Deltaproteobacteria-2]|nr:MAG: hypothetical protein CVU62_00450 [Deltaproteobacteria bacterium HGW-Deltaproteobacteria-2]